MFLPDAGGDALSSEWRGEEVVLAESSGWRAGQEAVSPLVKGVAVEPGQKKIVIN